MSICRSGSAWLAALLVLGCSSEGEREASESTAQPARYLYVWAGTGDTAHSGVNMMTVLDADPSSPGYGTVLSAVTLDSSGLMPHHTEFALPAAGHLFANDFTADKSYLVDFSQPLTPRLAGRVERVPGGQRLHSFLRRTNGHVLATVQFGDSGVAGMPGGLAEFDAEGKLVRVGWSRDSTFPGAAIRTYALAAVEASDRVVTTSSPMNLEPTAHVVQVWRLSDLSLVKTLAVPEAAGDSAHKYPFEVRALADGSVLLNTYNCGFFRIAGLEGTPTIERVLALPLPQNVGCSVPVLAGQFMIMPIAYAHRYATLDLSDPAHPKEVASFTTDSTFYPHWAATDPGSDRLVFTDQGDGPPMVKLARLDRSTGRLSWDSTFKDPGAGGPGVSFHRASWPNGVKGMAMPHGALFVP